MAVVKKPAKPAPVAAKPAPVKAAEIVPVEIKPAAAVAVADEPAAPAPVSFDLGAPVGELQEMMRKAAESGLEQSRKVYAHLKSQAEEASGTIENAFKMASDGSAEINTRTIEALRDNANAMFDLARSLTGAKSLSDVIVLQTEFARKQFEVVSGQAKDIASLVQKVATETAAPLNAMAARPLASAA